MSWDSYRSTYQNYIMVTTQVEILTLVSAETLKDFPVNLPDELKTPILNAMLEMATALKDVVTAAKEGRSIKRKVGGTGDAKKGKLVDSALSLFMSQIPIDGSKQMGQELDEKLKLGFERLLSSQGIIMTFAYLDAFMADSLRAVCMARPEVLKSEKKIEWSTALTFDNKEDLIRYLVERYVFEFGWLTLSKRIDYLKKEVGIALRIPESEMKLLNMAENIRHVAVHNGAKVSQEFIERTGRKDLVVGDFIPISFEEIGDISQAARLLSSDLFHAISTKYFGIAEDKLTGVWRRNKSLARSTKATTSKKSARETLVLSHAKKTGK